MIRLKQHHRERQYRPQAAKTLCQALMGFSKDIAALRANVPWPEVLKRALVRAANAAYSQGGVLSCTDLSVLFHRSRRRLAELICAYEAETGEIVPRRSTVHDMGPTVSHKRIICHKAYVEGKPTHVIARETSHSPEAVDHYIVNLPRVYRRRPADAIARA